MCKTWGLNFLPPRVDYIFYNEEVLPYMEVIIMEIMVLNIVIFMIVVVLPIVVIGMLVHEIIEDRELRRFLDENEL